MKGPDPYPEIEAEVIEADGSRKKYYGETITLFMPPMEFVLPDGEVYVYENPAKVELKIRGFRHPATPLIIRLQKWSAIGRRRS